MVTLTAMQAPPSAIASPPSEKPEEINFKGGVFNGIPYFLFSFQPQKVAMEAVFSLPATTTGTTLLINGGYFEQNRTPSGLLISGRQKIAPLSEKNVMSGIFTLTPQGARIIRTQNYSPAEDILFAVQNGPLIIEPGGKPGIYDNAITRARRTILAVDKQGKVSFYVFTKGISLYDCQSFLLNPGLKISAALNLDGGPSTAFRLVTPSQKVDFGTPSYPAYFIKVTPK